MILTIIILSILLIILGYGIYNLLQQLEKYDEAIEKSDSSLNETQESLISILTKIRTIDSKGIFENDDEVGQVFKQISDTIEKIETLND